MQIRLSPSVFNPITPKPMLMPIFLCPVSSPYFAQLFRISFALRLHFVARRISLCPEDDSIITILNTANHLPDYTASKFRRLQFELYRRASFTYLGTRRKASIRLLDSNLRSQISLCPRNWLMLNKLEKLKKISEDFVLSEMCVCIE